MIYDCLIVGAGPGGITAGIKLKNAGLSVAILEFNMPGGKVHIAPRVDNFPGYHQISGPDLGFAFFNKMNEAGVEMIPVKVNKIYKKDNLFYLETSSQIFQSKYVIVASGTDEKKLELPNEKELLGHGLSYCAICDGHFFKDKVVAVVAEDRYAISEAIYLAKLAKEVIVITSKEKLVGLAILKEELETYPNVRYIYQDKVVSLNGNPLNGIMLLNSKEIKVDGIFPLLGYIPNTTFVDKSLLDEDGFIEVDKEYQSRLEGLYAIGDVISREIKQIYLAVIDANKVSEIIINKCK